MPTSDDAKQPTQSSAAASEPEPPGKGDSSAAEVEPVIRKLAETKPELVERVSEFMMMGSGPFNPLHQKMNEAHVTQVLDLATKHDEREFNLALRQQDHRDSNRWFLLGTLALVLIAFGFVCVLFKDNKEILIPVVTGLLSFGAGALGGYGLGRSKKDN